MQNINNYDISMMAVPSITAKTNAYGYLPYVNKCGIYQVNTSSVGEYQFCWWIPAGIHLLRTNQKVGFCLDVG